MASPVPKKKSLKVVRRGFLPPVVSSTGIREREREVPRELPDCNIDLGLMCGVAEP